MNGQLMGALATDLYQISMAYAYWKANKHEQHATFDLFFRKNPFHGEYAVFAGLGDVLSYISDYKFVESDLDYIKTVYPNIDSEFIKWLGNIQNEDMKKLKVYAIKEGTVCFPRVPLITLEGPLALCQLLETPLLNMVNYATLISTNAARMSYAAGKNVTILEFGLRRAQGGLHGGTYASKYAYMGGVSGTSNVQAGKEYGVPVLGTHAHAFVTAFKGFSDLETTGIVQKNGQYYSEFLDNAASIRRSLFGEGTNEGELAAFISYAQTYPTNFLALVDTYDTLKSGVPNFISVALALQMRGYEPKGIRLDSGDLAYLSKEARKLFKAAQYKGVRLTDNLKIVASNSIDEKTIYSLNEQEHSINSFGIGERLVTCMETPVMGGVFKLVEIDKAARIKLSENISKVTLPGRKACWRLYGSDSKPILDLISLPTDEPPVVGKAIICRHPFDEHKIAKVIPTKVERLHSCVFESGRIQIESEPIYSTRSYVLNQLFNGVRSDHLRMSNPTPYKISLSEGMYTLFHDIWNKEQTVHELR